MLILAVTTCYRQCSGLAIKMVFLCPSINIFAKQLGCCAYLCFFQKIIKKLRDFWVNWSSLPLALVKCFTQNPSFSTSWTSTGFHREFSMAKLASQRNCHLEIERESGVNQKLTVKLGHLRPFAAQPREAKMILHQQRKPRENAGVVPKNPKKKAWAFSDVTSSFPQNLSKSIITLTLVVQGHPTTEHTLLRGIYGRPVYVIFLKLAINRRITWYPKILGPPFRGFRFQCPWFTPHGLPLFHTGRTKKKSKVAKQIQGQETQAANMSIPGDPLESSSQIAKKCASSFG